MGCFKLIQVDACLVWCWAGCCVAVVRCLTCAIDPGSRPLFSFEAHRPACRTNKSNPKRGRMVKLQFSREKKHQSGQVGLLVCWWLFSRSGWLFVVTNGLHPPPFRFAASLRLAWGLRGLGVDGRLKEARGLQQQRLGNRGWKVGCLWLQRKGTKAAVCFKQGWKTTTVDVFLFVLSHVTARFLSWLSWFPCSFLRFEGSCRSSSTFGSSWNGQTRADQPVWRN